jgi:enamine deaminase RidA (YjgF/YER057c/UK114 family)
MSQTAKRLAELGIVLPTPAAPVANYVPAVVVRGTPSNGLAQLWISGQLPLGPDGNGASDLMVEVFGERGKHARTTVGVAHLPLNALAEVEAVFLVSF